MITAASIVIGEANFYILGRRVHTDELKTILRREAGYPSTRSAKVLRDAVKDPSNYGCAEQRFASSGECLCAANARALLNSAEAVENVGHHNIAYHLATLSLEELGKKEIYQLQEAAKAVGDLPPWQVNAVQDHVEIKPVLVFVFGTVSDLADQAQFFDKRGAAADIHANRLAGLYVDNSDGMLNIPSNAVTPEQTGGLIKLAGALIEYAKSQKPREDIPHEELELQVWFLNAMDDPQQRNRILNLKSIERLKELNDVVSWTSRKESRS